MFQHKPTWNYSILFLLFSFSQQFCCQCSFKISFMTHGKIFFHVTKYSILCVKYYFVDVNKIFLKRFLWVHLFTFTRTQDNIIGRSYDTQSLLMYYNKHILIIVGKMRVFKMCFLGCQIGLNGDDALLGFWWRMKINGPLVTTSMRLINEFSWLLCWSHTLELSCTQSIGTSCSHRISDWGFLQINHTSSKHNNNKKLIMW
jgi:hypothetical protein